MDNRSFKLSGARVFLRRLSIRDAREIGQLVDDPEVVRWTLRIPHPYPKNGAIRFIKKSQQDWRRRKAFIFAICLRENDKVIGVISLSNVSFKHSCGELGFWSGQDYWGRGLMTEAVQLALGFAFNQISLFRVYASTFEENSASRRVLEKNGLKLEGVMREAIVRFEKRQNFFNYGILAPEFTPST